MEGKIPDRVPIMGNLLEQGADELGLSIKEYYSKGEYVAEGQIKLREKYGYDNLSGYFYAGCEAQMLGCRNIIFSETGPPNVGHLIIKNNKDIENLEIPKDISVLPAFEELSKCIKILKQEAGGKYPDTEKSFRQTICASAYSNRGFIVKVNRNEQKVLVDFNPDQIDTNAHPEWSKYILGKSIKTSPYWGFDDLFHKVGTKLHNCFFVRADSKRINGKLHFHYQDIFMLKALDKNRFIDAIENGDIYIDFDARTGHNHGIKFRLRNKALIELYKETIKY